MAVQRGRNGMTGEEEEEGAIFGQEIEVEESNDVPPHLLNLFDAAENGNLDALRNALGNYFVLFFAICISGVIATCLLIFTLYCLLRISELKLVFLFFGLFVG